MDITLFLDDEKRQELERLAALGYSLDKIALYFDIDQKAFRDLANNPESNINYHIRRGQLLSLAKEQLALLTDAESGDVAASQQLANIRRDRSWKISRLDIFGSFKHESVLNKLQDYIQSGSINKLSNEEAIYMEALTLYNSMYRKYGRRNTIAFFTKEPFNLKHSRASEMMDEALNLFYSDRNIEKKALRHLKAEQLEEAANIVRDNAQSSKDWEVYGKLLMHAAKLQELDKPDPERLPKEIYQKPFRIYNLDPGAVGIPGINRQLVADQIEMLEIPERDKIRVRKDAMLEQINIQETINELQEESQSE